MKTKLIIFLLISSLISCTSLKRTTKQVNKALVNYPEMMAKVTRESFPCITKDVIYTSDSVQYKLWKDSVESMNEYYDSLSGSDDLIPETIHDTITKECDSYKSNESKYKSQLLIKNKLIKELNTYISNVKPIHDSVKYYIEDSAKIKIDSIQINKLSSNVTMWKKFTIWLSVLSIGLIVFIYINRK